VTKAQLDANVSAALLAAPALLPGLWAAILTGVHANAIYSPIASIANLAVVSTSLEGFRMGAQQFDLAVVLRSVRRLAPPAPPAAAPASNVPAIIASSVLVPAFVLLARAAVEAIQDVKKMTAAYRKADSDTIVALRDVGIAQERAHVDSTLMTFHVCRLMAHLEEAVQAFVTGLRNTDPHQGTVLSDEDFGYQVVSKGGLTDKGGAAPLGKLYRDKISDLLVSVHARIVSCARRMSPPPPPIAHARLTQTHSTHARTHVSADGALPGRRPLPREARHFFVQGEAAGKFSS
jgi:hypothetical protein